MIMDHFGGDLAGFQDRGPWDRLPERILRDHEFLETLGRGSHGTVFKAQEVATGKPVVIKLLTSRESVDRERFLREGRLLADAKHPNIVSLLDFGAEEDGCYLIQPFEDGKALNRILQEDGPQSWTEVAHMLLDISQALIKVHGSDIAHRDIKPGNIIATSDSDSRGRFRYKLIDFGLGRKDDDERLTEVGFFVGTILYAPPERFRGMDLDPRSDLYSLGVTAWELLTGANPFHGTSVEQIRQNQVGKVVQRLPSLTPRPPLEFEELLLELLRKNIEERPADATALSSRLESIIEDRSESSANPPLVNHSRGTLKLSKELLIGALKTEVKAEPTKPARSPIPWIVRAIILTLLILTGPFAMDGSFLFGNIPVIGRPTGDRRMSFEVPDGPGMRTLVLIDQTRGFARIERDLTRDSISIGELDADRRYNAWILDQSFRVIRGPTWIETPARLRVEPLIYGFEGDHPFIEGRSSQDELIVTLEEPEVAPEERRVALGADNDRISVRWDRQVTPAWASLSIRNSESWGQILHLDLVSQDELDLRHGLKPKGGPISLEPSAPEWGTGPVLVSQLGRPRSHTRVMNGIQRASKGSIGIDSLAWQATWRGGTEACETIATAIEREASPLSLPQYMVNCSPTRAREIALDWIGPPPHPLSAVRIAGLNVLAILGEVEDFNRIDETIRQDEEPSVRDHGVDLLVRGPYSQFHVRAIEHYRSEPDNPRRIESIAISGDTRALPYLTKSLDRKKLSSQTLASLITTLAIIGGEGLLSRIRPWMESADPLVRQTAVWSVGHLRDVHSAPVIRALLEQDRIPPFLAIWALRTQPADQVDREIETTANRLSPEARSAFLDACWIWHRRETEGWQAYFGVPRLLPLNESIRPGQRVSFEILSREDALPPIQAGPIPSSVRRHAAVPGTNPEIRSLFRGYATVRSPGVIDYPARLTTGTSDSPGPLREPLFIRKLKTPNSMP